jgi:phage-related minor tail protein
VKVFLAYIAPLLIVLLVLAGLVAQVAVDAHHWMPRNWWPRSLFKKK